MSRKTIGNNNNLAATPSINIGAGLDVPTGSIIIGAKGEAIVNGGLGSVDGYVGLGNQFKSTIMHYVMTTAGDRIEASLPDMISFHTNDTEDNMSNNLDRFNKLANNSTRYLPRNIIDENIWTISTKSERDGLKWMKEILYPHANEKMKEKKIVYEAFTNRSTGKPLEALYPTFMEIDSLSELESDTTLDTLENTPLEKTNTLYMQQGLFKVKFMKDLPRLSNQANIRFLLTAHMGKKIDMSGPYDKPAKDLQYLKQDEKIKGVTEKINFLTTHLWKTHSARPLINQTTKGPEFPLHNDDVNTDLNVVKLLQFRSKTGHSGYILDIIVSQNDGVLPGLTNFYNLKNEKFGLSGSPRSFWLDLRPETKLSRTTVRSKLDLHINNQSSKDDSGEDPLLERAVEITREISQLLKFRPQTKEIFTSTVDLYEKIIELGYDWDILLQTRGWWTIKQYSTNLIPFLSTMDILKMAQGTYFPYWMNEDKTIKKEWKKHFKLKEK